MADLGTKNPFEALRQPKKEPKSSKPGEAPKEAAKKPAAVAAPSQPAAEKAAPSGNKRGGLNNKGRRAPAGAAAGGDVDKRGKRVFDKKSGTGVGKGDQSKSGHGKHNWGKEGETGEGDEEEVEQGDAPAADGAAAVVGEDGKEVKAAEPAKPAVVDKSLTFDEFQAQVAKKAVENDKLKAREVQPDDKKWGVTGVFKKAEEQENLKIGGKDAKKKEKDRKQRKGISLDEFVGPASANPAPVAAAAVVSTPVPTSPTSPTGGDRPFRGGRGAGGRGRGGDSRGRGRGGRGRGGRGGGQRGPDVSNETLFPKLG